MRNMFGINASMSFSSQVYDGDCFRTKTASAETSGRINKAQNDVRNCEENVKANPIFVVGAIITGFIGACALTGFFNAVERDYIGDPVTLIIVSALLVAACIVFSVLHTKDLNKRKEESDIPLAKKELIMAEEMAKRELGVPQNAPKIDVLVQVYTIDAKGREKAISGATNTHTNLEFYCYANGTTLCFCNLHYVFEVPVSSIGAIEPQKKKASFPNWYKEQRCGQNPYRQYKITYDSNRRAYYCKYVKIYIDNPMGQFYVAIPNYDLETFCRALGINNAVM